jgi:hypothetical protein
VQQAWSDLQQLPAPWNSDGATAPSASGQDDVIEFGELDSPQAPPAPESKRQAPMFGPRETDDAEDELPASIPIATARPGRLLEATLDLEDFDASIEAAEDLIDSFDEFEHLEIRAADPPEPTGELGQPAAQDPFAEPFDEEEIVLDPYSAFESELLRSAPQVINRLDRAFASELHRCVQRASGMTPNIADGHAKSTAAAKPQTGATAAAAAELTELAPVRFHRAAEDAVRPGHVGELLVIEDDDEAVAAAIISGRQFRRLFSSLEASGRLG